ncbi:MAG: PilZ domain-containing protein [Candidatus Coatesbacteria bacterium]|nr:MAG: PilZ domain-containing protein [Candidatus Coatesbacteria bacterium]
MATPKVSRTFQERRRYPRAEISLNGVIIGDDDREIEMKSLNISESGVLIAAREPLDEFTVISAVMRLPGPDNGKEALEVYCEGVVVRIEYDNASDYPYRIAVHFSRLEQEAKAAIREIVERTCEETSKKH